MLLLLPPRVCTPAFTLPTLPYCQGRSLPTTTTTQIQNNHTTTHRRCTSALMLPAA